MRSSHHVPLSLSLLLFLQITTSSAQQQKCFAPNGSQLDSTFAPCMPKSGLTQSGCCATNRTNGTQDICLDSGLCMQTNAEFLGTIWLSGCTDPEGKAEGCAKMCSSINPTPTPSPDPGSDPAKKQQAQQPSTWNIQTCSPGIYCCHDPNSKGQNCCSDQTVPKFSTALGSMQLQPPAPAGAANANTSTTTNTNTTSSSSSSSPSPSPSSTDVPSLYSSSTDNQNQNLTTINLSNITALHTLCKSERQSASKKTATRIGGLVGALLGALVISLLILIGWMYGREKRQRMLKEHYEEQVQGYRRVRVVYGEGGYPEEKGGSEVSEEERMSIGRKRASVGSSGVRR